VSRQAVRQIQIRPRGMREVKSSQDIRRTRKEHGSTAAGTRRKGKSKILNLRIQKYSYESWPSYHRGGKTIWRRLVLLIIKHLDDV